MMLAQLVFLAGLTLVGLLIVGFTVVVLRAAASSDGGAHLTRAFISRLSRSRAEGVELNRWAFYAHRVTGFGVFAFLCLHIVDVSLYTLSPTRYDQVHDLYGSAPMRLLECGLVLAVLFHTFNGLRLLMVDLADLGARAATTILLAVTVASVLLGGAASVVILRPLLT